MRIIIPVLLIFLTIPNRADAQDLNHINFSVAPALDWSNLFYRSSGWFGGDGIYTIPLNGIESSGSNSKKTLLLFSDTMIGQIDQGKLQDDANMIHNSIAILEGDQPNPDHLRFQWKAESGKPQSVFQPNTPATRKDDYYWLGDGFVNPDVGNDLFIFGYRVRNTGAAVFGFEEVGNTLIKIKHDEAPPFEQYLQKDTPFFLNKPNGEKGSFGAGIFSNTKKAGASKPDGYIYTYGVLGQDKKLLVSRVSAKDFENYSKWTYWDGQHWTKDIMRSAAVADKVSNELSLSELPDGRYVLIFQENGIGRNICMRLGKSPSGPFGPIIKLWDTSEALALKGFYSYNAKAHPSLSRKGELLISYNVNSFNFMADLKSHPNLYRPRFIKVTFK